MLQKDTLRKRYYIYGFLLTVMIALLLLLISSFLPQSLILKNISNSIGGLNTEGLRPYIYDLQESSSLDTYSDIEMLRATSSMHKDNLQSILTNDFFYYPDAELNLDNLEMYASGAESSSAFHYVRYWMGFRVFLRFALTFLNYFQIRRYLGFAFFCLLFALVFHVEKHTDKKLAYLFAISVILVRPNVIVSSLQYSCCFYIAFLSMFFIPWIYRNPKWQALFFMEVGMITMFFDFYSVPLITFGYPMVYLLAMQAANHQQVSAKKIMIFLISWLLGWGFMWIAKLLLTTLLTDVNGIQNGFSSFFRRVGIVKTEELLQYYSIPYAFSQLFRVIFSDFKGAVIYISGVLLCLITVIIKAIRSSVSIGAFLKHKKFLIITVMPVIWFIITAQPIAIHAFFQYRSIAIIYWSIFAYIYTVFTDKESL